MTATKRPTRPESQSASKGPGAPSLKSGESLLDEGDLSLIRSMLDRTPTERLERLQDFADGVVALRNGRIYRQ